MWRRTMLVAYLITAIAGGVLVVLSAIGGHGDHDVVKDFGKDFDAHGGGHAHAGEGEHSSLWIPLLSMRFWTYATAFFGATGIALTTLTDLPALVTGAAAAGMGIATGLAMAFASRALRRSAPSSAIGTQDLIGAEGTALFTISRGSVGKIRCRVKGSTTDLVATTDDATPIPPGTNVILVGFAGSTARVERVAPGPAAALRHTASNSESEEIS